MDPVPLSAAVVRIIAQQVTDAVASSATWAAIKDAVRERLVRDPESAETFERLVEAPEQPEHREGLERTLFDVVVTDTAFAGKLEELIAAAAVEDRRSGEDGGAEETAGAAATGAAGQGSAAAAAAAPVRGFPGLTVAATTQLTTAGTPFSIFVLVSNPFDVPITVHQVQTHIPVELMDVNRVRLADRKEEDDAEDGGGVLPWARRRRRMRAHPGVATAVGTDFGPENAERFFHSQVTIGRGLHIDGGSSAHFAAASFVMPPGADADTLDAVVRRVASYAQGVVPVRLQPGDSVVRQFVLKTRSRLLFRPLSYTFQIQVNYSVDGVDHTGTLPYHLTIQAPLSSVAWGALAGACLGTLIRSLATNSTQSIATQLHAAVQALVISLMASFIVVVAFARKTSAQPLVSVEDFWGGMAIGFSVGYFGFNQFLHLLPTGSSG